MLGLILDTFILMVLMRLITGDDQEGWVKPALLALGASVLLLMAAMYSTTLLILLGGILGVGVFVMLGCFGLMNIDIGRSALIAAAFLGYKIVWVVGWALLLGAAA